MDTAPIHDLDVHGNPLKPKLKGELSKKFLLPPFSVLNAREGAWQSRKKAWKRLGIKSELGRGANVLGHSEQSGNMDFYKLKRELEEEMGETLSTSEAGAILKERGLIGGMDSGAGRGANLLNLSKSADDFIKHKGEYAARLKADKLATPGGGGGPNSKYFKSGGKKPNVIPGGGGTNNLYTASASTGRPIGAPKKADARAFNMGMNANKENGWETEDEHGSGTSIFDPVLCELIYQWFSAPGQQVIDPFAGGSVRGIVAGALGRKYWGCDLSAAQIAANRAQVGILPPEAPKPVWRVGDAAERIHDAPEADMAIMCPPYFDLEVYSEDPADLSQMTWDGFKDFYAGILAGVAGRLRDDRFAVCVIGDVRDEQGRFRGLCDYTTQCFEAAGMHLYNTMILVTAVGSLSIRTERQFAISRKMGLTHQEVLCYVKGDPRKATDAATGMTYVQRQQFLKDQAAARAKSAAFEPETTDG